MRRLGPETVAEVACGGHIRPGYLLDVLFYFLLRLLLKNELEAWSSLFTILTNGRSILVASVAALMFFVFYGGTSITLHKGLRRFDKILLSFDSRFSLACRR